MSREPRRKARVDDAVRILSDVCGDRLDRIPAGSVGYVTEAPDAPVKSCAVDVAIRAADGTVEYDNVILRPEQFDVLCHPSDLSIDAEVDLATMLGMVAEIFGGRVEDGRVHTTAASIEVTGPWERDGWLEQRTGSRDYRYDGLVEAMPGAGLDEMVRTVSTLLVGLWAHDIPACARSQYNDRLPDDGGYLRWHKLRPGERGTYPAPAPAGSEDGDGGAA